MLHHWGCQDFKREPSKPNPGSVGRAAHTALAGQRLVQIQFYFLNLSLLQSGEKSSGGGGGGGVRVGVQYSCLIDSGQVSPKNGSAETRFSIGTGCAHHSSVELGAFRDVSNRPRSLPEPLTCLRFPLSLLYL